MFKSPAARAMIAQVIALVAIAGILATSAACAHASPRAVSLSDARRAPDVLRYVRAGHAATFVRQCGRGHYFSDVSAYRWSGRALEGQRWNATHDRNYWRDPRGGRVTFDGLTFRNATRAPVLVAGWCGG